MEILDGVSAAVIVGEIALLRDTPRTATVIATEPLIGYGSAAEAAFATMLELPGIMEQVGAHGSPAAGRVRHADPGRCADDTELYPATGAAR